MNINIRSYATACAALAALLIATRIASAIPFDGQSLTVRVVFGGLDPYPGTVVTFTVNSTPGAVEVPAYGGSGALSIDVFDVDSTHASVIFRTMHSESFSYGAAPNLIVFTDTFNTIPNILSVSLGAVSWPGATSGDIAFASDSFSFDVGDLRIVDGDFFRLDITTAAASTSVPDTGSTLGLLSLALGGIAFLSRKRAVLARLAPPIQLETEGNEVKSGPQPQGD